MTEQNKPENQLNNSVQNELDLDFPQMEPITPKKTHTTEPSLLDKAKGFVGSLGKKKSSGMYPEQPLSESPEPSDEGNMENAHTTDNANAPVSRSLNKPERWAILTFIPAKYRRIFIVLLIAVIALLLISLLKPSAETVNHFEQPSNSIPTQFQSLNQEQPLENNVLDDLKQGQSQVEQQTTLQNNENTVSTEAGNAEKHNEAPQSNVSTNQQTVNPMPAPMPMPTPANAAPETEKAPSAVEPKKSMETTKSEVKPHPSDTQNKSTTTKQKVENKAQTAKTEKRTPVVEAKPATASKNAGTRKTLTIPQGVSLMQVFRDNNLNISDVNAMTKANGAGNALSSFKPGDKVQISVNSQGRVEELRLSNGSYFSRQANGTYQYKK